MCNRLQTVTAPFLRMKRLESGDPNTDPYHLTEPLHIALGMAGNEKILPSQWFLKESLRPKFSSIQLFLSLFF